MPILIAAVAVVGGLCLLDLLMTFGVVRRLREHSRMLAGSDPARPLVALSPGELPGDFSRKTLSGSVVTGTTGLRVVAFLASWCSICPERVPSFIGYLRDHRIGRDSVLAVVEGGDDAPPAYLDRLAEVAQVCVEPPDGTIAKAFGVQGFPAFCLLDSAGALVASGHDPATLAEPVGV